VSSLIALLFVGLIFVVIIFAFRYYNHKTMVERVCSRNPDSEYCRKHYQKTLDKSDDQYEHCDVVFGKTPSGGVKTVICYIDENNRRVKKGEAVKVMIRELDEKNKPVFETWSPIEEAEY